MNRELLIAERLNAGRLVLRGFGASIVLGEVIGFAYLLTGLVRASSHQALPGWNAGLLAWAAESPMAAISAAVGVIAPTAFAIIALTWLPTRRKFKFDRASAYEIVGRYRVRHRLEDFEIQAGPPRLLLAGKTHHISKNDWERLTAFYRGLANERTSFVRAAAMGAPATKPRPGVLGMMRTS